MYKRHRDRFWDEGVVIAEDSSGEAKVLFASHRKQTQILSVKQTSDNSSIGSSLDKDKRQNTI